MNPMCLTPRQVTGKISPGDPFFNENMTLNLSSVSLDSPVIVLILVSVVPSFSAPIFSAWAKVMKLPVLP